MSEIIGVVGAGTMGNGIAQVAARAGYTAIMRDVSDEFLQRGLAAIDKSLQRDVDKQRLDASGKQSILERIRTTTDLEAFRRQDTARQPRGAHDVVDGDVDAAGDRPASGSHRRFARAQHARTSTREDRGDRQRQ